MNLAQNSRKFLTNLRTISFSTKALFNGIAKDGASRLLVKICFRIFYCGYEDCHVQAAYFLFRPTYIYKQYETNSMDTEDMSSSFFRNICTAFHDCTALQPIRIQS